MIIKHLMEIFFNPFFISLLLLIILTLVSYYYHRQPRFFSHALCGAVCILIIASTGWLPYQLTKWLEKQYPPIIHPDLNIPYIVVLSGGQAESHELNPQLLYCASIKRLLEGVRLVKSSPQAKLILSGGSYPKFTSEAAHLAGLAKWFSIADNQLILESKSLTTAEQAHYLKPVVGNNPFYLVTSAVHMPRSMQLMQAQGLHPIAAPSDFTLYWQDNYWEKRYFPNPKNLFYFTIAWHEILGIMWIKIRT